MVSATRVADWIVRFRHDALAVPVDPMSLEKLAYYAQSFYLALHGEALFKDEVTAWKHGPVIRAVWDTYREYGAQPIIPSGNGSDFKTEVEEFLAEVISFFGSFTAIQLSNATHAEDPWLKARSGFTRYQSSDIVIPKDHLRSYYCELVAIGEEALSRHELLDVVPHPRWANFYVAGICNRRMYGHPFYNPSLAKRLSEKVPELPDLDDDFYAPIGKPDYMVFQSKTDAA